MTPEKARRYRLVLVVVTLLLLAVLLWLGRGALTPFVVGSILAYLLLPLVRLIERNWPLPSRLNGLRRPLAILSVYLVTILVITGLVNLVVPPLSDQIIDIIERGPEILSGARDAGQAWLDRYHALVPDQIEEAIEANLAQGAARFGAAIQTALAASFGWLLRTANVMVGLLVIPLWLFYVLRSEHNAVRFFHSLFPPAMLDDVRNVTDIINSVLGRYIRGQLTLGLIIGILSFIGLTFIGLPYALLLAVVNGVFELIPIIGPWLGAIPAVIVTLAVAPDKIWMVILFYALLQQVENLLLVPKVQGDAVQLNPAIIIMAILIGGEIAGFWGILAAVPLTAVTRDVIAYLYRRFSAAAEPSTVASADPGDA